MRLEVSGGGGRSRGVEILGRGICVQNYEPAAATQGLPTVSIHFSELTDCRG